MNTGLDGFIADLRVEGVEATLDRGVVIYHLVPVSGAFAGRDIPTGVGGDETQGWPAVPPHWIHLPQEIQFATTNADHQGVLQGWARHSRDIGTWELSRPPILNWIAHVRCVIGQAI